MVRISLDVAVPGEMLADRLHAGRLQAVHQRRGQRRDHIRVGMEGAVTDDATDAAIEIEHWREAEIDIGGPQLGRHQPAGRRRHRPRPARLAVVDLAEAAHRRQHREALAEALHAPALVIDADQQPRRAQRVNFGAEFGELARGFVVAREQDHAADARMAQQFAVGSAQREAGQTEHDGTERHLDAPVVHWIQTSSPACTRSNSSMTSALRMRMQPCERGTPIGSVSGVPWM